ncbi:MAG: hypothetical protein ACFCUW_18600 [Kiloniellaceae bacterium]
MTVTTFQRHWIEISKRLGLSIQLDYEMSLQEKRLVVPVLLEGFGAEKGMLLVTDYPLISDVTDEITALGYGFSCLSPAPGPIDWPSVMEMLQDWGATG